MGTIVSGHKRVWAQSCVGTIVCGHNRVWAQTCVDTNVCGHNRVWAQSCLGTIVSGHKRVWAQSCVGTIVCGHYRVGTIVWAQSCGLNRGGTISVRVSPTCHSLGRMHYASFPFPLTLVPVSSLLPPNSVFFCIRCYFWCLRFAVKLLELYRSVMKRSY